MNSATWLQIFPLVSLVFTLGLGTFVLSKNIRALVNRLFFLISLVLAVWLFGTFMMLLSYDDNSIILWDRFVYLGVVFMPLLQYHFSLALTKTNKIRKSVLFFGYAVSIVFFLISRTDRFITGIFRYAWGAHSVANFWHHIFLLFFFFYIFAALYNFFKQRQESIIKIEKQRLLFLIVAFAFLNIIGGLAYLPAYQIQFFTPITMLAPWGFSVLVGYAMVVHRLMDISLVVRRLSVSIISVVTIVVLAFGAKRGLNIFFIKYEAISNLLILVSSILLYSKVKKYYFTIANLYFFTSLYNSHKVVSEINDKLRSSLDIDKIYSFVYEALSRTFRADLFAVISINKNGNFLIKYNKGFDFEKKRNVPFSGALSELFLKRDKTIFLDEIGNLGSDLDFSLVIDRLREMGVEIITPLKIENKISGLIFLGPKKSGDIYTLEDVDVLDNISVSIAMAVKNAMLHEDALAIASKMHAQKEKFSAILSNFIDPIIFIDKYGCLGMVNPAAEDVLGMKRRDLGKELDSLKFKTEELKKIICTNNNQTFGKPANDPSELREIFVTQANAQVYYKVLSTEVISDSEEFLGTLKIFYDLTKEKALDKSKSEFVSVAAHQLRTPLSAVKWIIESFLNKELGEITTEQKQYLDMASISNQKLITTVNEFLNVSKIEAGSLIYDFEECSIEDIFIGVKVDVENIAKNKNIKLVFNFENALPKIMADKRKIFIVVENLISNAINYTPENGKIVVEVKRQDKKMVITVRDNGIGIPKEEIDKIFTKFFRASNAVRVQPDGSGLGLFIIKNIVKIHKGEVLIESEEGVGTMITIKLPIVSK